MEWGLPQKLIDMALKIYFQFWLKIQFFIFISFSEQTSKIKWEIATQPRTRLTKNSRIPSPNRKPGYVIEYIHKIKKMKNLFYF